MRIAAILEAICSRIYRRSNHPAIEPLRESRVKFPKSIISQSLCGLF